MASRTTAYVLVAVIVIVVAAGGYWYWMSIQTPPVPPDGGTLITLYGGEISSSIYGFGLTRAGLRTPGPTLNFTYGTEYTLTFMNAGQFPHALVIKAGNNATSATMWGAAIGSASTPISPGQSGSVTFTPTQLGTFYYVCPVPGHKELGMYGLVIVRGRA